MAREADPRMKFADSAFRSYGISRRGEEAKVTFRAVEDAKAAQVHVRDRVRVVVEDGRPGARHA